MNIRLLYTIVFAAGVLGMMGPTAAHAGPIVLNPDFETPDEDLNGTYNSGSKFWLSNWRPVGFASNSAADPDQYDNGSARGHTIVGFLSEAGRSLSQVVNGFDVGTSYQVSVYANARARVVALPTFTILVGDTEVLSPTTLTNVDPDGTFTHPFLRFDSGSFVAASTSLRVTFANTTTSSLNASRLLTACRSTRSRRRPAWSCRSPRAWPC